jgi:diguanylate cyclase (GGDEF)-like protein/PAS domain S-box-containing protein
VDTPQRPERAEQGAIEPGADGRAVSIPREKGLAMPSPRTLHRLLARQMQRQLGEVAPDERWRAFLQVISSHYTEADQERSLLENALEVNSLELTQANERLRAQSAREHALLRGLLDSIPDLISFKTSDGVYSGCNRAFEAYLGKSESEIVGRTDFDFLDAHAAAAIQQMDRGMLAKQKPVSTEEWVAYPDGRKACLGVVRTPYSSVEGKPLGLIVIGRDITEKKRAEQQLTYLAQVDTLTGLPNRHMLYERLSQTIKQAQRSGQHIACMYVDLDRFKMVNDTYGHWIGDKLLVEVAARLRGCLREDDTVGRLGGDEFAIVLNQLTRAEDAAMVAQKVIDALAQPFDLEGHESFATASIGIAIYPGDGDNADDLLRNADTAMYRAKEQGRNNHQFYLRKMNERLAQRLQLESSLRGAMERGEFTLHYQPKAELAGGAMCGFEALLRWERPGHGLVSPAEFVPVLEDTGLIVPVGEWVLSTVCAQIQDWQRQGLRPLPVAVNISARQFQAKILDGFVARIAEARIDPSLIKLELTESLLMKEAEESARTLDRLKASGVRLSVDDFGTGYSSLAYLKRFPLDEIKIDRAFIRDVISDPDDAEIALTIIKLAHSLNLRVVAEGVETEAQLSFLRSHGCDEIQGYYFARPQNLELCTAMLREERRLDMSAYSDPGDGPAVLLLDDNPADLELMERALAPGGYPIITAATAEAALDLLTRHPVSIVISDHTLPGMGGVALLSRVRKLYPAVLRMMLSGDTRFVMVAEAINEAGIHKYLSKDWDAGRLRAEVREAYVRNHGNPRGRVDGPVDLP